MCVSLWITYIGWCLKRERWYISSSQELDLLGEAELVGMKMKMEVFRMLFEGIEGMG